MRILVVAACPFPAGRGSQILVERMTQGLLRRGHEIEVVVPRFGDGERPDPFPLCRAGLPRLGRRVNSRPDLLRTLDDALLLIETLRHRPDVVVGHNVEGALVSGIAARLLRVPSVFIRHTAFAEELTVMTQRPAIAHHLGSRAERAAERLAGTVVELAPHPRRCGAPRREIIPPPADPEEKRIEPADGRTLYYEGNRDPYQNPSWLEDALEAARQLDPRTRLVRAAGPGQRPARADLALLPRSLPGGFPMKLLAYQVAGIPAVCVESGAPGMVDGEDAFVVPGSGSPVLFARRVVEALQDVDGRERLRARARERTLARNDPERVSGLLEAALLRACMEGEGRRPYIR